MSTILIIDDEKTYCDMLVKFFQYNKKEAIACYTSDEAIEIFRNRDIEIALLDINLKEDYGVDILKTVKKISPNTSVIMMTGEEDVKTAITCMKAGADEYFIKPLDTEELLLTIEKAERKNRMQFELDMLRTSNNPPLIGNSTQMNQIKDLIEKAATNPDITVLVTGETGTGKELVARHIHYLSNRKDEPFIPVNCSGIPEQLIESEFFGHEKGAFTGADHQRKGVFERANGGTVFLDEIGDMDIKLQTRLLRLLEEKRIYRLGGGETDVDVRIICATNQNLTEQVNAGLFRKDLFFRINILNIHLAPLRDRMEDIPQLARHFINYFNKSKTLPKLNDEAKKRLFNYNWPGNVRELRNIIERELVVNPTEELTFKTAHLSASTMETKPTNGGVAFNVDYNQPVSLTELEKLIIEQALAANEYNVTKTAQILQIGRSSLRSKMKRLNIAGRPN